MSHPSLARMGPKSLAALLGLALLTALLVAASMPAMQRAHAQSPQDAWRGQYYANQDLSGLPTVTRLDERLSFDWGQGSPDLRLPPDRFSARWTRELFFEAGRYRFLTTTDDGVRLFVDGQLLIDQWHPMAASTHTAEIILARGVHSVRMEYFERTGFALARLSWRRLGEPGAPGSTWRGQYYANRTLTGEPALVRFDESINFDWDSGSPDIRLPPDNFSVRWTRAMDFSNGRYTFFITADDRVRFYVDGQLLTDDWVDTAARVREGTITLDGRHTLRLEYYEHLGQASVSLRWQREPTSDRLVGNIVTCVRTTGSSWIKVYRRMPDGTWQDMNPEGWGSLDESGYLKIDGLPIHPYYGSKGQPYRVELWDAGSLITQVGNTAAGQPEWRLQPFANNRTPWQCPAP